MEVIHGKEISLSLNQSLVVTMGVYDGVHAGHQHILKHLTQYAQSIQAKTLLLTFYPHPRKVLFPEQDLFLLNTLEERIELLNTQNIDYLWVYPFDKIFSQLSAEDFVKKIIVDQLHAHTVFVGYDHKFGKNREGGYLLFKELGKKYHFEVIEIPAYRIDEVNISSTNIRKALLEGDISTANQFLKYPYKLTGTVIQGNQLGRTIGFPTANIQLSNNEKLIPKQGVYVSEVKINHQQYYCVTNIGQRPTLQNTPNLHIETHIFDFDKDIYGQVIEIYPLLYIRQEQKFATVEELSHQIKKDKEFALQYIEELRLNRTH